MNGVSMSLLAKNNCHMRERANVNIHTYIHTYIRMSIIMTVVISGADSIVAEAFMF